MLVLTAITQPLTANQLARRTQLSRAVCSQVQAELVIYDLVTCLNPLARRSRLYWLTELLILRSTGNFMAGCALRTVRPSFAP